MSDAECSKYRPKRGEIDIFFPRRGEASEAKRLAKELCDRCPVIEQCRNYKNQTGTRHGIWAGDYAARGE